MSALRWTSVPPEDGITGFPPLAWAMVRHRDGTAFGPYLPTMSDIEAYGYIVVTHSLDLTDPNAGKKLSQEMVQWHEAHYGMGSGVVMPGPSPISQLPPDLLGEARDIGPRPGDGALLREQAKISNGSSCVACPPARL